MARRVTRRVAVATVLVTVLAAGRAPGATGPTLSPVSLPRDHGAHPRFGVEWWYTAGTVSADDGHPYFWFATAWANRQGVVARVNVVDLHARGETPDTHPEELALYYTRKQNYTKPLVEHNSPLSAG